MFPNVDKQKVTTTVENCFGDVENAAIHLLEENSSDSSKYSIKYFIVYMARFAESQNLCCLNIKLVQHKHQH
jgi:hypothetical protein